MRWSVTILAVAGLTACATSAPILDPGCIAYGEARLSMPRDEALPSGAWGVWIADTDDRMTGTCRG